MVDAASTLRLDLLEVPSTLVCCQPHPVQRRVAVTRAHVALSCAPRTLCPNNAVTHFAGAFVARHCAELGLPDAIAVPAAHLVQARVFDTRGPPHTGGVRSGLGQLEKTAEALQKAPVFLAILTVCKHALKAAEHAQVRRMLVCPTQHVLVGIA